MKDYIERKFIKQCVRYAVNLLEHYRTSNIGPNIDDIIEEAISHFDEIDGIISEGNHTLFKVKK
ncbi:MAG: hypothetical protein ACTSR1_00105 [Candidatus Heimdallarchaeota archaeon]